MHSTVIHLSRITCSPILQGGGARKGVGKRGGAKRGEWGQEEVEQDGAKRGKGGEAGTSGGPCVAKQFKSWQNMQGKVWHVIRSLSRQDKSNEFVLWLFNGRYFSEGYFRAVGCEMQSQMLYSSAIWNMLTPNLL